MIERWRDDGALSGLGTAGPASAHTSQPEVRKGASLLTIHMAREMLLWPAYRAERSGDGVDMHKQPTEVPYGTLDLMILRTLDSMGRQHGYGIARRIEQSAQGALALNQGTVYPALLRLEQKGWIASEWGASENNRRARFYAITRAGGKQLAAEAKLWERTVAMMSRLLGDAS